MKKIIRVLARALSIFTRGGIRGVMYAVKTRFHIPMNATESLSFYAAIVDPPFMNSAAAVPYKVSEGQRTILWVIPPPMGVGGGHTTLTRTIRYLRTKGFHNIIAFFPHTPAYDPHASRRYMLAHGLTDTVDCTFLEIQHSLQYTYDIAMATAWETAYIVSKKVQSRTKGYFVQDYEAMFYPEGGVRALAEHTYRLGMWGICASKWLSGMLHERYGMATDYFELGVDHKEYYEDLTVPREKDLVIAYVRSGTPRRGFELIMLALKKIRQMRPDVRIEIFGDVKIFRHIRWVDAQHGVLDHTALRHLYQRATVGVVLSCTNYSLIPNEMMACGLPVVDISNEGTRKVYAPGSIVLAEMSPQGIADAAASLLNDRTYRDSIAQNGRTAASTASWESAFQRITAVLSGK